MKLQKLQTALTEVLAGMHDHRFVPVIESMHCMSTPRVYAVLNAVVSSMDPGELYVEVGTYQGGSLVSALLDNDVRAIGVDSFGEFAQTNSLEITTRHLQEFGVLDRVTLRDQNFREFFAACDSSLQISVYYYDGAHDYKTQLEGMEAAWPYLRDGSIVLVDDYTYNEVSLAVNQFVANHRDQVKFQLVFLPNQVDGTDPMYWNGIVVMRIVK